MPLLHNHTFEARHLFFCLPDEDFAGFDHTGRIDFTKETRWFRFKEYIDLPEDGSLCIVAPEWAEVFGSECIKPKHSFIDRLKAARIARFSRKGAACSLHRCTDLSFYEVLVKEHVAAPHPQGKFDPGLYPSISDPATGGQYVPGYGFIDVGPETKELNGPYWLSPCCEPRCGIDYAIITNYELIVYIGIRNGYMFSMRTLPLCR